MVVILELSELELVLGVVVTLSSILGSSVPSPSISVVFLQHKKSGSVQRSSLGGGLGRMIFTNVKFLLTVLLYPGCYHEIVECAAKVKWSARAVVEEFENGVVWVFFGCSILIFTLCYYERFVIPQINTNNSD